MTMTLTQVTTGGVDENINIDSNTLKVDGANNRVGIGTAAPTELLSLSKPVTTSENLLSLTGTSFGDGEIIYQTFRRGSVHLGKIGVEAAGAGQAGELVFETASSGTVAERLRIDSSGRVGIGASNAGSYNSDANDLVVASTGNMGLTLASTNSGNSSIYFADGTSGSEAYRGVVSYLHSQDAFSFYTAGGERMRIDSSGNVGIGTSSPTSLLFIRGGAATATISSTTNTANLDLINSTQTTRLGATNTAFAITHNGSERMRIDSSGNVGIGASAVSFSEFGSNTGGFAVQNVGGSNTGIKIGDGTNDNYLVAAGNGNFYNSHYGSGSMIFGVGTSGTERMRIDDAGRLLVGTNTNRGTWFNHASTFNPGIQLEGTGGPGGQYMSITANHNAGGYGARYLVGKTRGTAVGATTVVQNNDELGGISFFGSDGSEMVEAANIVAYVDSPPGANDMPGSLRFSTTADNAAGPTERMRLDKDGSLNIGCLSNPNVNSAGPLHIFAANGQDAINIKSEHNGNVLNIWKTNTGQLLSFYQGGSQGSVKGSISISTTSVAFNTSSDYRLKENVVALDGAITRVKQLQPKRFNFIVDADTTVDGFLAHEAQTVVPEAVTGTHDEVDDDGNAVMQGIDQSKLVPLLTAALQEAIAKIETLETKVAALEAAG